MLKFLRATGIEGCMSLDGVVLSITGVEAMYVALGHFSALSIKVAFTCLVYPCLILAYIGETTFLSKHHHDIQEKTIFWLVFIVATLAAIVGSQAVIFDNLFHCKPVLCTKLFSSAQACTKIRESEMYGSTSNNGNASSAAVVFFLNSIPDVKLTS
ncbi:Potassium transporter 1 [Glycine max]|nr:Potassium transporter 1 [Glycine max]